MKRLTLEATDENVLKSIKEDTYGRNADVKDFVEALDKIEGNMFISLDGKWGEGKSFFVRQIEKTLEYCTKRTLGEKTEIVDALKPYFISTKLNSISLDKSYLPIYYNAWLYDNHDDPLMSLVFIILKRFEQFSKAKINSSIGEKVITLLSAISFSFSNVRISINGDKIGRAVTGKDILEKIKTSEEIRELVKEILRDIRIEKAEKLVIFIDELDRCKPSYAIEMLERIKHYFDDDNIIFIVSVNKEQLVHTISKCYGNDFDSTGYLNKFFDLNIHMPVTSNRNNSLFEVCPNGQIYFKEIVDGLNDYYKLSIRDALIFKQRISNLPVGFINDDTLQGRCLSLFIPILVVLDIKDENEKVKFLNGDSDILEKISRDIPAIYNMVTQLGTSDTGDRFEDGLKKYKEVYDYTFKNRDVDAISGITRRISADIRRTCIKVCNSFGLV